MTLLSKLPYPIAYFLGYRHKDFKTKEVPLWRQYIISFIAAWIGIALLEIIFTYSPVFVDIKTPMIAGSFGATAVLVFGVMGGPLSQPRQVFFGQVIGATAGVCISKLFIGIQQHWASEEQQLAVHWVSGATAMAFSLLFMQITGTIHPPGGATAVIATTSDSSTELGWAFIGVVALSAAIQIAVGLIFNNIEGRYPVFWWAPYKKPEKLEVDPTNTNDIEKGVTEENNEKFGRKSSSSSSTTMYNLNSVEKAISILQQQDSQTSSNYILLVPGHELIATPGFLSDSEKDTFSRVLAKLQKQ
ncbi:hypothetical protein K501DRAFT_257768 [Backusella circina FSU 941]|nr:hypothetical protein K501DRAFT_257768 [Backusella circina FSU 941]